MRESELVRTYREKAGLSQFDVARELGYDSGQFISNIERGLADMPNDKIGQFCKITKLSPRTYLRVRIEAERRKLRMAIFG